MATASTTSSPMNNWNISGHFVVDYPDSCVFVTFISCVLSIFGALGIFCTYGLLPEIRNVTRKLIICLTVADLLSACGFLVAVYRYARIPLHGHHTGPTQLPVLCLLQSVSTTYSTMASFFLTIFIGVHLATTVTQRRDRTGTKLAFVIFNLISWIAPGIIVYVAWRQGVLGEDKTRTGGTGSWCWINTEVESSTLWMLLVGKGWEILCFLITISIFVLVKYYQYLYYQRSDLHGIHESLRNDDSNVLYLWFVFYVLRIWGTLRFLIYALNPEVTKHETYMKVLLYMQSFGDPAQAFCNFIFFCVLDKTVRTKMRNCCRLFRNKVTCDSYRKLDNDNTEVQATDAERVDRLNSRAVPMYDSFVEYHNVASQTLTTSEMTSMT